MNRSFRGLCWFSWNRNQRKAHTTEQSVERRCSTSQSPGRELVAIPGPSALGDRACSPTHETFQPVVSTPSDSPPHRLAYPKATAQVSLRTSWFGIDEVAREPKARRAMGWPSAPVTSARVPAESPAGGLDPRSGSADAPHCRVWYTLSDTVLGLLGCPLAARATTDLAAVADRMPGPLRSSDREPAGVDPLPPPQPCTALTRHRSVPPTWPSGGH